MDPQALLYGQGWPQIGALLLAFVLSSIIASSGAITGPCAFTEAVYELDKLS